MTAHYRLGVGVNHAFRCMHFLRLLLQNQQSPPRQQWGREFQAQFSADAVANSNSGLQGLTDAMVQYQLRAMFFEAYCNLVVYGDELFAKAISGKYEELTGEQAAVACLRALPTSAER